MIVVGLITFVVKTGFTACLGKKRRRIILYDANKCGLSSVGTVLASLKVIAPRDFEVF